MSTRRLANHLTLLLVPLGLLLMSGILGDLWELAVDPKTATFDSWALPLGYTATLALALASLARLSRRWPRLRPRLWHGGLAYAAAVAPVLLLDRTSPPTRAWPSAAMVITALLASLAMAAFLTYHWQLRKLALLAALLVVVAWTNGGRPYKLTFPGLDLYYEFDAERRAYPRLVHYPEAVTVAARPDTSLLPLGEYTAIYTGTKAAVLERAIRDLERAIALDPKDPEARVRYAAIKSSTSK